MKRSSAIAFRVLTVCLTVIVAVGVSRLAGSRVWTDSVNQLTVHVQGKMKKPPALANHLKRMQAIPGNGGMSTEGPGSAEAEKFLALAFPDDDVPLARLQGARAAAARLRGRFPRGNGRDGTWVTVGPSDALYPATDFRSSFGYVPNRVRRRRTRDGHRHRSELQPGTLPALGVRGGRRRVADQ
jgi:hypothetical protein